MDRIKVKKEKLLKKLKKNRKDHRTVFEDALEGYREKAIELLQEAIEDAKIGRRINTHIELERPMDRTKDYDIAMGMLEMCVDEEIEITMRQYKNYVMDEWSWMEQFVSSNTSYVSSSSSASLLKSKSINSEWE